jgi:hypothetical protein
MKVMLWLDALAVVGYVLGFLAGRVGTLPWWAAIPIFAVPVVVGTCLSVWGERRRADRHEAKHWKESSDSYRWEPPE